jgi:hypothetical protein
VQGWTNPAHITVLLDGRPLGPEGTAMVKALNLRTEAAKIVRLVPQADGRVLDYIELEGGQRVNVRVAYYVPDRVQSCPLPEKLGCKVSDVMPFNGRIQCEPTGATGVPGIFVCGDAAASCAEQVVTTAASAVMTVAMGVMPMLLAQQTAPRPLLHK